MGTLESLGPWKITLEPGAWWADAPWWWLLLYHDTDAEILAPLGNSLRKLGSLGNEEAPLGNLKKAVGLSQGRKKKKKDLVKELPSRVC